MVQKLTSREPARVYAAITAAITATTGLVTLLGLWSAEVGGGVAMATSAWVLAVGEVVRSKVTPNPQT